MVKGAILKLGAVGVLDNGTQEPLNGVVWTTSQPDVAAINAGGEVTGAGEGVAHVGAEYQGVMGTTLVTVGPAALVSIAVSPDQSSLPMGESEQFTATGTFSDGSTANLTQSVTWSSSASIASVSAAGAAVAKAVGTATISAASGSVAGSANLAVTPAVVVAVNVMPATLSLPVGSGSQLQAIATLSDGTQQAVSSAATWQTSQSAVATVNSQGYATAVGKGVAQLAAAYQGATGGASITVVAPALVSIAVSPNQSSLPLDETEQLTATGTYTDGSTQNLTQTATWSSSAATIATVNATGSAAAKAGGTATISATSGSVTGTASIAVTQAGVVALNVVPAALSLPLGSSSQLQAMATMSDGTTHNMTTTATWSSTQPSVATVNAQGSVTAAGKGSAQVSAAYQGFTGSAAITVGSPALVSIAVNPISSSLPVGKTEQLIATGIYTDGSTQNLTQTATWSSSAVTTATVNAAGAVVAKTIGTAAISASSGSVTGTASLAVTAAVAVSVNVVPATLSLPLGSGGQLQAIANMSDGTQQTLSSSVTWQTSQSAVAAVNVQGYVTAAGKGSAQVSATYQGLTGSASIAVGPAALVSMAVSPSSSLLPVGQTAQMTATGTYTDGSTQNLTQTATWNSSAVTIATVSAAGAAVGKAIGTAAISASSGSVTGTASVAVTAAVAVSVNVVPATLSLPLGSGGQLQAIANMSDGTQQTLSSSVTWQTSQSAIATVNAQGYVTAAGKGSTQVSAAYQGLTGSASITVGPPALVSIAVNPNQSSLPVDETAQMTATGTYTDGSTQNLTQTATWSSSAVTIATVNATGSAVGIAVGTATISATSGTVAGTASLTVSPAAIVALNIVPATLSITLGSSSQLQAIATYSDGTTQNKTATVNWSSMAPGIAVVSSGGLTTAEQVGSTTILAQTNSFTASANITVMPLLTTLYFNRANAQSSGFDSTIRLTNPDTIGGLCAMIYVFDRNQELNECCGCSISDSGMRTLSLLNDLTANPLTGKAPVAGTIEVVSSDPTNNPQCNPGTLSPTGQIIGWGTNVQASNGSYQVTESTFADSALNNTQATVLATECGILTQLGSGQGICTCGTGDN